MIERDEDTGDMSLPKQPGARLWREFFALMRTIDIPDDFMVERPMNAPSSERDKQK